MRKNKLIRLTLICVLVGLTIWVCATAFGIGSFKREEWRLGLDLRGGVHVVYEADTSSSTDPRGQLNEVRNIIENRVNAYGVDEPIVAVEGVGISIQLPGIHTQEELEKVLDLIGQTAELNFRKLAEVADDGKTALAASVSAGDTTITVDDITGLTANSSIRISTASEGSDYVIESVDTINNVITIKNIVPMETGASMDYSAGASVTQWIPATSDISGVSKQLTGEYLVPQSRAIQRPKQSGIGMEIVVLFKVEGDGVELLQEITTELLDKPLGIFLDNNIVKAPPVGSIIPSGEGKIRGLERDEALILAIQLNQGALPIPLEYKYNYFVSGTLGADSLNKSLLAGGIGLILVLLFMIAYYRLPGLVASVSLIIYVLIVLSIFKLVPITLTLGGIAALVLSIGMAVDANVLIFERLREEIRFGRTVGAAIEAGFDRAWTSIRDSNISTIITCIILYWFGNTLGTTIVMGFALSLLIGVLVSMFTAILITKSLLRLFIGTRIAKKTRLFFGGSKKQE